MHLYAEGKLLIGFSSTLRKPRKLQSLLKRWNVTEIAKTTGQEVHHISFELIEARLLPPLLSAQS